MCSPSLSSVRQLLPRSPSEAEYLLIAGHHSIGCLHWDPASMCILYKIHTVDRVNQGIKYAMNRITFLYMSKQPRQFQVLAMSHGDI